MLLPLLGLVLRQAEYLFRPPLLAPGNLLYHRWDHVALSTHALDELAVLYPVNGAFYTYVVRFVDPSW